ncbi:MAG TPA: apolipoprotein N-acyltransferase [Candidatus Polarisedimenticolaceae bacterium]
MAGFTNSRRDLLLPLGSGLITLLAFPPMSIAPLAFVGLVPLFIWLDRPHPARTLLRGGLAFAVPYVAGCIYWMFALGSVTPLGLLAATIVVTMYVSTFFIFPIVVNAVQHTVRWPLPLFAPFLWIVSEHARGYSDMAFPVVTLGYALCEWPSLLQHADLVGVWGVSAWVAFVNAAIAAAITSRDDRRARLRWIGALVVALALPACYGASRWRAIEEEMARAPSLRVALLQPNIAQQKKWNVRTVDEIYERLDRLVREAEATNPDLVVGPEASFPIVQPVDAVRLPDEISAGTRPLLLGSVLGIGEGVERTAGTRRYRAYDVHYNAAVLADAARRILGRHDKVYLVPVAERLPYARFFGGLLPLMEKQFGRFRPGSELRVLNAPTPDGPVPFGALVCYESLFPDLARRLTAGGARFLANISNDAWFGRTSFPYQHAGLCALRAIENRRSVVRSANTGISAAYDPLGRLVAKTDIFQEAILTREIPLLTTETAYAFVGDAVLWLAYAVVAACLAAAWRRRR